MTFRIGLMAVVAAAFVAMGVGCTNTKQEAQLNSLIDQNKKLQEQIQAEQAARVAAESRANAATNQVTAEPQTPTMGAETAGGALDLSTPSAAGRSGRTTRTALPSAGEGITSSYNSAGEVVLEIPGDVLFDSGKATIKAAAKKTLDNVAATIKREYASQKIRIEGHTDPAPVKTSGWDDNWDLGAARARQVMLYLSEKGVKGMYIASFAATEPKSTKNQSLNRRVDIVVVKNAK